MFCVSFVLKNSASASEHQSATPKETPRARRKIFAVLVFRHN